MSPIDFIAGLFSDICSFFYDAYLEVKDWAWPLSYLQYPFYNISLAFLHLYMNTVTFGAWVTDVSSKISNILSAEGVLGLLKYWFPWLADVGEWFVDRWKWFMTAVGDWWATILPTVLGWIETAKQFAVSLVANVQKELSQLHTSWDNFWTLTWPQWSKKLDRIDVAWDNFWVITFPTLISKKDANDMVDSKINETKPFWECWQDVRDDVVTFIGSPFDWLAGKLEDWFWGVKE